MSRLFAALLCAAIAVLCLSACGGAEDSTPSPGAAPKAPRETGEQSIEGFGSEATGSHREQILVAERAYLTALCPTA